MTPAERKLRVYHVFSFICWLILKVWNRMTARGRENVPPAGGLIIAANHASILDPPIIGGAILDRRVVRFMARDSLYKPKIINWLFTNLATIPISREKGDLAALKKSIALLKEGYCVCLFPEGTRTPDGNLQEAKGGIGFLIAKAGVPVVPAYVWGTFYALPRGASFIRPRKVGISYGKPITPDEIAALGEGRDAYEKAGALVMSRIAELKREVEAA